MSKGAMSKYFNRNQKKILNVTLATLLLFLSACASATLKVTKPVSTPIHVVSVNLLDATTEHIPDEDFGNFKASLTSYLQNSGINVVSSDKPGAFSVVGKVMQYDSGNAALRYFVGYGAGKGTLESTWSVINKAGNEEAICNIDGSISMGAFGGDFNDVHHEVAKALQRFLLGATE